MRGPGQVAAVCIQRFSGYRLHSVERFTKQETAGTICLSAGLYSWFQWATKREQKCKIIVIIVEITRPGWRGVVICIQCCTVQTGLCYCSIDRCRKHSKGRDVEARFVMRVGNEREGAAMPSALFSFSLRTRRETPFDHCTRSLGLYMFILIMLDCALDFTACSRHHQRAHFPFFAVG